MFGFEFLLIIILLLASAIERRRRLQKVDTDLDDWAKRLGMTRVGDELFGRFSGIPVGARLAFDSPHKTRVQPRWTLYARLQPPLDLGLLVCNARQPVTLAGAGRSMAKGDDDAFNRRFTALSDDPGRALALLDKRVRQRMIATLHREAMVMLTDGGVAVQTVQGHTDETTLREGLQVVSKLASAINKARKHVPAAMLLSQHRPAWVRFAGEHGLQLISAPLCMFGRVGDAAMYAYSVRMHSDVFQLEVWLRFDEPLALGLLVQPMTTVDRVKDMFGSVDHKLGDDLFDATFLVRVSDAAGTSALLDAETRQRLLIIHDAVGPLSLTDDGISVRLPHVPQDPKVVPKVVGQMLEIARFIAAKRRGQRVGGPYR